MRRRSFKRLTAVVHGAGVTSSCSCVRKGCCPKWRTSRLGRRRASPAPQTLTAVPTRLSLEGNHVVFPPLYSSVSVYSSVTQAGRLLCWILRGFSLPTIPVDDSPMFKF
eukprot:1223164-Pyramimonas_sp.AAC.1